MLRICGFGEKWCNWLEHFISSMRFFVLVNGTLTGFFSSFHGLRLGDPLSPLLFVIVMVVLSRIISSTVNEGLLLGFWVESRNVVAFNISPFVCGRFFNLTSILGGRLSSLHMKYLSLLLLGALFKIEGIIDKIERCLAGWKMMYLYGREVLPFSCCCRSH